MSQYAFSLSQPPVYAEDNFSVSVCNEAAWRWVMAWPHWPAHALLLYGPKGSGKSHLGYIWAARADATIESAQSLPQREGNVLVEDIDQLRDERALLHLFNRAKENGASLLLTSAVAPQQLAFSLPDLTSRLRSIPLAALDEADDALLAVIMRKQFADRQMKVEDEVIAYLLPRMERSLGEVNALVERLDREALAQRRNVTIPFVKSLLEKPL